MLVITRKPNESIEIGSEIKVTVLSSSRNSVKIGIEAPPDLLVLRNELEPHCDSKATSSPQPSSIIQTKRRSSLGIMDTLIRVKNRPVK